MNTTNLHRFLVYPNAQLASQFVLGSFVSSLCHLDLILFSPLAVIFGGQKREVRTPGLRSKSNPTILERSLIDPNAQLTSQLGLRRFVSYLIYTTKL